MPTHPLQPIVEIDGIRRFKANAIVQHLLDKGSIDLNMLSVIDFSQEDREQFAQLIGYSVSGFGDLSYVRDETIDAAEAADSGLDPRDAMIESLRERLLHLTRELQDLADRYPEPTG